MCIRDRSIPAAIASTAKWAIGLPIAVAIITWLVFSSRTSGAVAVLIAFGAALLSILSAVLLGGALVAKKRLAIVSQAADRVVDALGEVHSDVVMLKDGASRTTVQELSIGLLQHAVLPIVFGVVEGASGASSGGVVGKVASLGTDRSMKLVEKSVIAAVKRLPDRELGSIVSDMSDTLPATAEAVATINNEYQRIGSGIEGIVARVSKATVGSSFVAAGLALIPLLLWLAFAWLLT